MIITVLCTTTPTTFIQRLSALSGPSMFLVQLYFSILVTEYQAVNVKSASGKKGFYRLEGIS
jgi:hypothetical protein